MGAACSSCTDSGLEEFGTPINVSNQFFTETLTDQAILSQIKQICGNEIEQKIPNLKFYKKNDSQNTYFLGDLEQINRQMYGVIYRPKKTIYIGQIYNGLLEGHGVLQILDAAKTYTGEFKEGKIHGKGILISVNEGYEFQGRWDSNSKPLEGKLKLNSHQLVKQIIFISFEPANVQIFYKNEAFFQGFIDKKTLLPHGSGKMNYASGDVYEGEWVNGKFQGKGTYIWKYGQKYQGEYFEGLRHGDGDFYDLQGKHYTGYWKKGVRDGYGKVIEKNGIIVQKGIYRNNKLDKQQTQKFNENSQQKIPREQLKSQLYDQQQRDDISIQRKMSKKSNS